MSQVKVRLSNNNQIKVLRTAVEQNFAFSPHLDPVRGCGDKDTGRSPLKQVIRRSQSLLSGSVPCSFENAPSSSSYWRGKHSSSSSFFTGRHAAALLCALTARWFLASVEAFSSLSSLSCVHGLVTCSSSSSPHLCTLTLSA